MARSANRQPAHKLRCPSCRTLEAPEGSNAKGPEATGAENTRRRRGPQGIRNVHVYHIRCSACKHDWWSSLPRAKTLSNAKDREKLAEGKAGHALGRRAPTEAAKKSPKRVTTFAPLGVARPKDVLQPRGGNSSSVTGTKRAQGDGVAAAAPAKAAKKAPAKKVAAKRRSR